MHQNYKWLHQKQLLSQLERWGKNIQDRIEWQRKKIDEEPTSEEDDKSVKEPQYREPLDLLKRKLHKMARYDY